MPNWQARGFGMAFVIIFNMETKVFSLFDTYDLKARFFPAFILACVIIYHIAGYGSILSFESFINYSQPIKFIYGFIGLSIVLLFLWPISMIIAKLGDLISRLIYSKNGLVIMPTTAKLLPKPASQLSKEDKDLRTRIKQDYGLDLLRNRKHNKEIVAEIGYVVKLIIEKVRDEKMVTLNLTNYGVMRNLLAVFAILVFFELCTLFCLKYDQITISSFIPLGMAILALVVVLILMRHYGKRYSDAVYTAFLTKTN